MIRFLDRWTVVILVCLLAVAGRGQAQEVVAVLTSDLTPYTEAFEGFEESLGRSVPMVNLASGQPQIGRDTRIVVAFGGKAALMPYPDRVRLIFCLAPGVCLESAGAERDAVKIRMTPPADTVLASLKEIHPGLLRLAVLWVSETMDENAEEMRQAGETQGVEVVAEVGRGADDLPDRLRGLLQKRVNGLWLPPDPLLINAHNFSVIKEFCWANHIPLFVPTAGLVEKGAVASVSSSFREIGRVAGRAAARALAGGLERGAFHAEVFEVVVNLTAAANTGLSIPPGLLSKATRVVR